MPIVDIGITVRSQTDNPWLARLLESLNAVSPGIPATLLLEDGEHLTRVEKRMRLLRRSTARYICIVEDDTEAIQSDWLLHLLRAMGNAPPGTALISPQETRDAFIVPGLLKDELVEVLLTPGFCYLMDRDAGLTWDPRVQTMDDLYLSLLARTKGYRLGLCGSAVVRHTKQPWLRDDLPPWEQGDRSRFGEADAYYQHEAHERKRLAEVRILLEQFGPVAWAMVPPELQRCLDYPGGATSTIIGVPSRDGWQEHQAKVAGL